MKVIGLLGGLSWESTLQYYRIINEAVKQRMGGLHSAKIIMYSLDFQEIVTLQSEGKWQESTAIVMEAAKRIEKGGAEFFLICCNTMHRIASEIKSAVSMPLLHIVDTTAYEIRRSNISKVGLLATRFTMEQNFYRKRLEDYDIEVLIPNRNDRETIHNVIYNELCLGKITEDSKSKFSQIISKVTEKGAKGIILGCTEISLLLKPEEFSLPLFDTMTIHATSAADYALSEEKDFARRFRRI